MRKHWLIIAILAVLSLFLGCGRSKGGSELTGFNPVAQNSTLDGKILGFFEVTADPEKESLIFKQISPLTVKGLTDVESEASKWNFVFSGAGGCAAIFVARNTAPVPASCGGLSYGGTITRDTIRQNVLYANNASFPIYDTRAVFYLFTNGASLRSESGGYISSITITSSQLSPTTQTLTGIDMGNANNGGGTSTTRLWIIAVPNGAAIAKYLLMEYRWRVQNTGTSNQLFAVDFTDASNGWASGVGGTILNTTNGGGTWSSQTSGTVQDLYDIQMITTSEGFACGDSGTILHTTDGGANWSAQTSGTAAILLGIHMDSANTGWVVGSGGVIIKTKTGGSSWTAQTSGTTNSLADVFCTNNRDCWAVGAGGVIVATTNGGTNWSAQTSGTTNDLSGIYCTDSNNCWVAGDLGTILRTTNGGSTWSSQTSGTSAFLAMPRFSDSTTGWIAGDLGTILRTTDGGTTWTSQSSNTSSCLNGLKIGQDSNSNTQIWTAGCSGVMQTYK